jgi:hypothetical protein
MTTLADLTGLTEPDTRDEAARRLDPLLPATPPVHLARQEIATRAATALATQLDDPLDQVVIAACQDAADLDTTDTQPTDTPEQPVTITLGRQSISRTEQPWLELEIGNLRQPLLQLTLKVEIEFTALVLDILDNDITRIHPSTAEASVTLTAAGVEIAHREKVPLTFPDSPSPSPDVTRQG